MEYVRWVKRKCSKRGCGNKFIHQSGQTLMLCPKCRAKRFVQAGKFKPRKCAIRGCTVIIYPTPQFPKQKYCCHKHYVMGNKKDILKMRHDRIRETRGYNDPDWEPSPLSETRYSIIPSRSQIHHS